MTDAARVPDLDPADLRSVLDRSRASLAQIPLTQGPLVFVTVSGAHLYGFPSQDSDIDLRGVHVLPIADLVGVRRDRGRETTVRMWRRDGVEMDLVTHDAAKFAGLLLRPNGYVLEQLVSPLVVHTTPFHEQLKALVPGLLTAAHADHYRGFAETQRRLFGKTGELKSLLYVFRTLLTGIHLMRGGEVQADLSVLAELEDGPGYLRDLIAAKAAAEHSRLAAIPGAPAQDTVTADVAALFGRLDEMRRRTGLPDAPSARAEVEDLVIRARIALGDASAFVD